MSKLFRFTVLFLTVVSLHINVLADDFGVVFYRTAGTHLYHENVPKSSPHHSYPLEGPAWENHYCTWRTYIDSDNRNAIDLIGKYKYIPTLSNYDNPISDVHADNPWGTDMFEGGFSMGLGPFRLIYGDNTWKNPELGELDSMVIDLLDTTYESPKLRIAYWGWELSSTVKVNVFWTLQTRKMMRPTACEVKIEGSTEPIKVVVGMSKLGVKLTQDADNCNLITLGKQSQKDDSLLMAIHADKNYFDQFTSNSRNYAMILKPDQNQRVKWAFMYSWVKEPDPVFRKPDWKKQLFGDLDSIPDFHNTIPIANQSKKHGEKYSSNISSFNQVGKCTVYNLNGKKLSGEFDLALIPALFKRNVKGLYIYIISPNNRLQNRVHIINNVK